MVHMTQDETVRDETTQDETVRVVYRKYDDALHWHLVMRRLGTDRHGTWLGLPADSVMHKGDGPPVPLPQAHVILFPHHAWYTASFNADPARTAVYCDITTPADWSRPGEVTMVDLDLDVVLRRGETDAFLVDQDEFAEHQVRYGYPAGVVDAAEASAEAVLRAVTDRTGPFDGTHESWLQQVSG